MAARFVRRDAIHRKGMPEHSEIQCAPRVPADSYSEQSYSSTACCHPFPCEGQIPFPLVLGNTAPTLTVILPTSRDAESQDQSRNPPIFPGRAQFHDRTRSFLR